MGSLQGILGSQESNAASQGLGSGLGLRQSIYDLAVPQGLIGSQSGATGGVSTTHLGALVVLASLTGLDTNLVDFFSSDTGMYLIVECY